MPGNRSNASLRRAERPPNNNSLTLFRTSRPHYFDSARVRRLYPYGERLLSWRLCSTCSRERCSVMSGAWIWRRDVYANAMAESVFATLEREVLDRHRFKTQAEAHDSPLLAPLGHRCSQMRVSGLRSADHGKSICHDFFRRMAVRCREDRENVVALFE